MPTHIGHPCRRKNVQNQTIPDVFCACANSRPSVTNSTTRTASALVLEAFVPFQDAYENVRGHSVGIKLVNPYSFRPRARSLRAFSKRLRNRSWPRFVSL